MRHAHKNAASNEEPKPSLVPRLRFPEFEGAWETLLFAELYEFKPTNSLSRDQLNYESGPAKNIHYGDIHTQYPTSFNIKEQAVPYVISADALGSLKASAYCQEGDMVFADASEDLADVGKSIELVTLNGEKVLSGSHTLLARQKSAAFIIGFAGYLFKCQVIRKQIERQAQGTKVLQISPVRLAGINVCFPGDKSEQQRIASCLSSLDELITAQARKVDALKTHKKGLMQQLFPREGEIQPRLRFPEFEGAWEEIELGAMVDLLSGYPFDGPDISQDSSGVPLLRGINVTEGRIRHSTEIDRFYCGPTEGLERFRLQANDLVIGMDGSKVGKNSALVSEADAGALLIQRVARLRARQESAIQFIFQRINSPYFHAYVDRINTSSGIPHVSSKQIKEFRICVPSEAEQQRIASCLSPLDELITNESHKLETYKTHKKGLMQGLFPKVGD